MHLRVEELRVAYPLSRGYVEAVRGVSLDAAQGETVGLVGESGCGKTTLARALLRLLPPGARVSGRIVLGRQDLLRLPPADLRRLRGRRIGLIPQEAMSGLNPVLRVGDQVIEAILLHEPVGRDGADRRARELFEMVGLGAHNFRSYPHELSGGMRQRVLTAMVLAPRPRVLVADEPTVGLDVLTQARVLGLLKRLQNDLGITLILISHDLPLVLRLCDRVTVMYAGRVVESGPVDEISASSRHPYSVALIGSAPTMDRAEKREWRSVPGAPPDPHTPPGGCAFHPRCSHVRDECSRLDPALRSVGRSMVACHLYDGPRDSDHSAVVAPAGAPTEERGDPHQEVLLQVREVTKTFPGGPRLLGGSRRGVEALRAVDLVVRRGEAVGVIGESGSGKTTLALVLVRLLEPTGGEITFNGGSILALTGRKLRDYRRRVAIIFQDSYDSLHPAMNVEALVAEPLVVTRAGPKRRRQRVIEALYAAGLQPTDDLLRRYPGQLSGGQRQRVALARGLASEPELLIADEPASMLDASVRGGVLNTLLSLRRDGLSILLITHDLAEAIYLCDTIYVLRQGRIVERGPGSRLVGQSGHPYTEELRRAVTGNARS